MKRMEAGRWFSTNLWLGGHGSHWGSWQAAAELVCGTERWQFPSGQELSIASVLLEV